MFLNTAAVPSRLDQHMLDPGPIRKRRRTLSGTRVLELDGDG